MTDDPLAIARAIGEALAAVGAPWAVGGSVASSVHGLPRATQDIDVIVGLGPRDAQRFSEAAIGFHVDAETLEDQLRAGRAYNVFHAATMTKVDLFPAVGRFERSQLRRAEVRAGVPVVTAEDAVLAKLRWYRLGGERSERQWTDVLGVITVRGAALDLDHLRGWAAELAVGDLLERALAERANEGG